MENRGFYKLDNEVLMYAPNKITNKAFVLTKEEKDTYTYPSYGWYWFDTLEEAETFFITQGWEKPEELME